MAVDQKTPQLVHAFHEIGVMRLRLCNSGKTVSEGFHKEKGCQNKDDSYGYYDQSHFIKEIKKRVILAEIDNTFLFLFSKGKKTGKPA